MTDAKNDAYVVLPAKQNEAAVLVSIPHTGTSLPAGYADRLASDAMRALPITDWHLHQLYDFLPDLGVTVLHAVYNRFVVDLNRPPEPQALYPGRFETGLVPTQTFNGDTVFSDPPGSSEIERMRQAYHAPYHAQLQLLIDDKLNRFGQVVLIDAHSIASFANQIHDALTEDIYLGDRDGQSCDPWLSDLMHQAFADQDLRVARNAPYKGGYITSHYGDLEGVQALQIEMCQRVYMDEQDPAGGPQHARFDPARSSLRIVFDRLVAALL